MSRFIKKWALFYGADLVGITELDQRWVYVDKQVPLTFILAGLHKTPGMSLVEGSLRSPPINSYPPLGIWG